LKLWAECPQRFTFRYLDKVMPDADSDPAALGRALHLLAERYTRHCWAGGLRTDYDRGRALAEEIEADLELQVGAQFAPLAAAYIEHAAVPTRTPRAGIEQEIGIDEETHAPVPYDTALLRGRVDRWTYESGRVLISDLKTSWVMPPESEIENDVQLAVNAYLIWKHLDDPEVYAVTIQLEHVRYIGHKDHGIRRAEFHASRLTRIGEWIKRRTAEVRAVERGESVPAVRVGDHCRHCPFIEACPAYAGMSGVALPARSPEEAAALADRIGALEEALKRHKAALKEAVSEFGPLAGSTAEAGIQTRETMDLEPQSVLDAVRELGGTVEEAVGLLRGPDRATIRKLDARLRQALEARAQYRTDTALRVSAKKEEQP